MMWLGKGWRGWVCLVFLLYVAQYTVRGFLQAEAGVGLGGDQTNIALIELRLSDDSLFQRDYAFADASAMTFYTPGFVGLMRQLREWTGRFEYGLASLVPIVMLTYLAGMALLTWQLTRSPLATLLVPLISAEWKEAIGATFWGVAGIRAVMPRTLFLMLFPWLFLLFWRWREDERLWPLPFVLFLLGLTANLHPVSGFLAVQILLIMMVLSRPVSGKQLARVALGAGGAVIGVFPTLRIFVGQTGLIGDSVVEDSFAVFARVVRFRFSTIYPFDDNLLHQYFTPTLQELFLWIVPVGLLLIGTLWWLGRHGQIEAVAGRHLSLALQILLLPLYLLLTDADAPILILYALAYGYLLFRSADAGQPSKDYGQLLQMAVLVVLVTFVASGVLAKLWEHYELWGLTSIVGEQIRGARFIYVPLYLWLGQHIAHWDSSWANNRTRRAVVISLCALLLWRHLWLAALFVVAAAYYVANGWAPSQQRFFVEGLLVTALVTIFLAPLDLNVSFAAVAIFVLAYLLIWVIRHAPAYQLTMGAIATLLTLSLWLIRAPAAETWWYRPIHQLARENLPMETADEKLQQDSLALYRWARTETPVEALFFYDSIDFRLGAQRSISHAWKDLGLAYYTRVNLVPFARRIVTFDDSYASPETLVSMAQTAAADYIVIDPFLDFELDLPIVYRNGSYTVYELR